jgi:cobalt transporter subunit CbtB
MNELSGAHGQTITGLTGNTVRATLKATYSVTAPATVSGEECDKCHWETGKVLHPVKAASQETCRTRRRLETASRRVIMTATTRAKTASIPHRISIGLISIFFGMFFVYGVGIAQDSRLHNAAHDTRHSLGFPCH